MTITQACRYARIDRTTYYNWCDADEGFLNKMEAAQDFATINAKRVIAEAIAAGDVSAAKWWAERKAKDEFATRSEHTGADGAELFEREATKLSELIALAKANELKPEPAPAADEPDSSDAEGQPDQSEKTDS